MDNITKETRKESYIKTDRMTVRRKVLEILREKDTPMSAREIAQVMYDRHLVRTPERGEVQPRLTELKDDGYIIVFGKGFDEVTQRKVAMYVVLE